MPRSLATIGTRARAPAHVAGRGLMSVLLVAILAAMAITFVPGVLGYQRYVLVGGSMEPTIHRGSLVFDEVVAVISRKDGRKGGPIFRTQGDHNRFADMRPFQLDRPRQARFAFAVPYLGWLFIALGNPRARFILLAIPALLIALSMLARLWREGGRLAAQREAA